MADVGRILRHAAMTAAFLCSKKYGYSLLSNVDHPPHYNQHGSGVECIDVVEWMTFNLGNVIKYVWRADHKGQETEDLQKALWYLQREIDRREKVRKP
jgi:hypothetical protein